jgi:acyl-coenzyme A synthetase/AMP-(fatty) acid ligase
MYGQAALGPRVSTGRSAIDDFVEGDVGRPLPGVKVRIDSADEAQNEGIITVDSPYRMSSYVTMDGPLAEIPGWWATGDIGYLTDDGHLHVLGRTADDVNFLGARVRLSDIRTVVRAVRGVLDARVSAVPHHVYGQRPAIRVLVRTPDDSMELELRKALGHAMGDSAGAVLITIVDLASLPESGKL